ncbi:MAG TPA: terminase family protein [Candidatus Limnocylindrales bacterium]|nr:terminase family protein [Candidatus Limnocylindrales bacterium]
MRRRGPSPEDRHKRLILAALEAELRRTRSLAAADAWTAIARPSQRPPAGPFRTWLILTGRGWGKTRTGAETIAAWVRDGSARRIAVVARTESDLRDVAMAALRTAAGPDALYVESRLLLRWPNGAEAIGFSAERPDSLRGVECDTAWCEELAAWAYPDAYDQLQFALRVGLARQIVTTTPRPVALIRRILDDPSTITTRGRTFDNAANLTTAAIRYWLSRYGGTRLGRQELEGDLLDDLEGGLWQRDLIDRSRVRELAERGRTIVAVDPAMTSGENADETGIVVVAKGADGQGYVLADLSGRYTPDGWARRAVEAYRDFGADRIIAEVNQGGDLVAATLRTIDPTVPYAAVTASHGKRIRAEPIAALYEQRRVHHVGGFPELEDQMCAALPDGGTGPDDRLDALVYGLTELDLTNADWDAFEEFHQRGVWPCECGDRVMWIAGRSCRTCGRPAPLTYDAPVARAS